MFLAFGPTMLIQFITFFFALAFMLSIHPLLTLVAILPLPGVFWVGMKMRRFMFPISWIVQARAAEVATIVDENVTGVRIVKSFTAELQQIRELAKAARRVQWANVKQVDVRARYSPVLENLPRLALVFVLFYGGFLVTKGQLDLGAILLFMGYIVLLTAPFRILGFMLMLSQRARASADRIYEILDTRPDVQDREGAIDLVDPTGDVEFRDVTFGYADGPPILEDFSLRLQPGEVVALVGRTGCGKSTVARLLMRFYDVDERRCRRRRSRRARPHPGEPAFSDRTRRRRRVPFLGLDPQQHRLRASQTPTCRTSSTRRRPPVLTTSSSACPTATTP